MTYECCFGGSEVWVRCEFAFCESVSFFLYHNVSHFYGRDLQSWVNRQEMILLSFRKSFPWAFIKLRESKKFLKVTKSILIPISIYTLCHWNVPCLVNEVRWTERETTTRFRHVPMTFIELFGNRKKADYLDSLMSEKLMQYFFTAAKSLCERAQQMQAINFSAGRPTRKSRL